MFGCFVNYPLKNSDCFTRFQQSIADIKLPERFTFPFYYQPHQLALLAAQELQQHISQKVTWQHNFFDKSDGLEPAGKMFGVLVVKNQQDEIGYLSAFSGKLADQNVLPNFVPPVFDLLAKESFFITEQQVINDINNKISAIENSQEFLRLLDNASLLSEQSQAAIEKERQHIIQSRKIRKQCREQAKVNLSVKDYEALEQQLSKESVWQKIVLRELQSHWQTKLNETSEKLALLQTQIQQLKALRKNKSAELQTFIFQQYQFLNINGQHKNLAELFQETESKIPPAGAGDCAAPKLLHYAFKYGYQPLALAEFWWGAAPQSELRRHGNFYPACQNKCQPILAHMLTGMLVDDNPLLLNPAEGKQLDILYQDDDILVVNKPAEFLSVPGKNISDSVYLRIKQAFPQATGPLIVHRLDMSTSGLMVIALTKSANKTLQQQFIKRTVKKRYVALLDGVIAQDEGDIDLPLRVDLTDRPRQLVCYQHGKSAQTHYQVIARNKQQTRVYFYPKTGRTHQLRVHAAHSLGLNSPIVGDDHYGTKAERLHLHAESLSFVHPVTGEPLSFVQQADF